MNIDLITARELEPSLLAVWSRIQRKNPSLHSPFFRPEFTQLCARVHRDVEIAVLSDGGTALGFFPFHRVARKSGVPIGKEASDFHGVIAIPTLGWSLAELMRGCRLTTWQFHHLITPQAEFEKHALLRDSSSFANLSGGFAAYRVTKRQAGSKGIERTLRSQRRLVRDEGPLQFQLHDADQSTLSLALAWQREHLLRGGTLFFDRGGWREALYRECIGCASEEFSGWYTTLRAGGTLVSVNIFLRSYETAHWWFTAYDARHGQHAPSAVALLQALEAAADLGVQRVDFGRGQQELKLRLRSSSEDVTEGIVEIRPLVRTLRRACQQATRWLWDSPLKVAAKDALRRWRAWHGAGPAVDEEASHEA